LIESFLQVDIYLIEASAMTTSNSLVIWTLIVWLVQINILIKFISFVCIWSL